MCPTPKNKIDREGKTLILRSLELYNFPSHPYLCLRWRVRLQKLLPGKKHSKMQNMTYKSKEIKDLEVDRPLIKELVLDPISTFCDYLT